MSRTVVLDASAVLAHMLNETEGRHVDDYLDRASKGLIECYVPGLLLVECANALIMAERRRRLTASAHATLLEYLTVLPVRVDYMNALSTLRRISFFATRHRLSAYDASYLELAERVGARLVTLDKDLLKLGSEYDWIVIG